VCELTGRELTLESALQAAKGQHHAYPRRIAIRDGAETQCVDVEAIDWIDAAGDYMCLHSAGDTFVLRGTMKHLEGVLDPDIFVRVHRSAIVNRHRVTAMRPHRNGEYFLQLGDAAELKLSRKYKSNLERLANHI
jgi:two-component system LytT family response regulator